MELLKAQAAALRFQMEATYITLADNVVAAVIQEASLNDQIEATKRYIDENEQGLKVLQDQFRSGYAGRLDLAAQESSLAQARAMLPPLTKQLEQTHDLIRALVGGLPNDDLDMTFSLASLSLPRELPVSLPGQLIEQRPDVRAAEEQLHAANAQVGVAIADRLPQFTITAAYGGVASEVSQMFAHGGPFWNLIGDVNQPVFDGGTLRHHQRAAEQGLIAARAQYKTAVITAYQNVADTLHAIQSDADGLKAVADAETAAKTTLDVTRQQYEAGYVNYLTLLAAQGGYEQAMIARVQAQTNRYGDAATLFQALGGGWWNRNAQARADRTRLDGPGDASSDQSVGAAQGRDRLRARRSRRPGRLRPSGGLRTCRLRDDPAGAGSGRRIALRRANGADGRRACVPRLCFACRPRRSSPRSSASPAAISRRPSSSSRP